MRPATMCTSSRTWSSIGSTARSGTLAAVPVERLFRSTSTYSSAEAAGRLSLRRRPGASLMMSASAPLNPLVTSESAPRRITIARLGEPASAIAARKPSPIDSTATKTITTPAMPTIATADELRRCGMVRTLSAETMNVWETHRNTLRPPERVGDAQAHRGHRGQRAGDEPERGAQGQPDDHVAGTHDEDRQQRIVEGAAAHDCPHDGQAESAADQRQKHRFSEHKHQDERVREPARLQHGKLARSFPHRLRHG